MDKDEIIRMAREAGLDHYLTVRDFPKQLKHFATLVAAHEREACAKVCENWDFNAQSLVKAIRARSKK